MIERNFRWLSRGSPREAEGGMSGAPYDSLPLEIVSSGCLGGFGVIIKVLN